MAIQEFTMYMHVKTSGYGKGQIQILPFDQTGFSHCKDQALLREFTIEADVPDFNLDDMEVNSLEKELHMERAYSQIRQNILIDQISKLKAIGHEVIEG